MEEKEKGNKTRKEYSRLRRNLLTNTFYLTYQCKNKQCKNKQEMEIWKT